MKSWKCELCGKQISELGAYVKRTNTAYQHLGCSRDSIYEAGRLAGRQEVLDEQAEVTRRKEEEYRAAQQAKVEQDRAKALAVENAKLEAARIANLTQVAREALKREMQGEAKDRFSLIEIDNPVSEVVPEQEKKGEPERGVRPLELE